MRGGEGVVSARLPKGAFDDLSAAMWQAGELWLPEQLENPHPYSRVTAYTRQFGELAVGLAFEFGAPSDITDRPQLALYEATVGEVEPLVNKPGATIERWRSFTLHRPGRRIDFQAGTRISDANGEVQLLNPLAFTMRRGEKRALTSYLQRVQAIGSAAMTHDYTFVLRSLDTVVAELRAERG